MYFLVALGCALIAGVLWFIFKDRKGLHLDILALTYAAATLMWFIDCCFSAGKGEGFLAFDELVKDGWISLWTVLGGVFLWLVISFILNNRQKIKEA